MFAALFRGLAACRWCDNENAMHTKSRIALDEAFKTGWKCDTVDALKDVLELDRLAGEVENAPAVAKFHACNHPVRVGTLELRRPSLGVYHDWLPKFCEWADNEAVLCDCALFYALCHPADIIRRLDTPEAALAAVRAWKAGVKESYEDLLAAALSIRGVVRQIAPDFIVRMVKTYCAMDKPGKEIAAMVARLENPTNEKPQEGDAFSEIIARLIHHLGMTPEYWAWELSAEDAIALMSAHARNMTATAKDEMNGIIEVWHNEAGQRYCAALRAFKEKYNLK